ncbi:methyltransferase domain-containing protein [bacterium]|nr:methyltransferase domain-containing protein [bacterium]MBU1074311.1 methyltransferase domain-containing protein [bacterium]MBU1674944.1 methyltransferase domain-containing protein [bacterium]
MDTKERLEQLAHGYQNSVILLTALQEGLIEAIGRDAHRPAELAARLELDGRAVDIVLHALAAAGVLDRDVDGRFSLPPDNAEVLLPDGADSQARIFAHHYDLMRRWVKLDTTLRTGEPVPREQTARKHRNYICGMQDVSRKSSRDVADSIDMSGARRLLDVGGGPATASLTLAAAYPELECVVFDLPETVAIAREVIVASGLADRVSAVEGDYFADDFGEGFDVVYVSNIVHSIGAEAIATIYRKAHPALVPGGRIMVKDFFLDDDRCSPSFGARFAVNMLVATQQGRAYTRSETIEALGDAGFDDFEVVDVAKHSQVIIGHKS